MSAEGALRPANDRHSTRREHEAVLEDIPRPLGFCHRTIVFSIVQNKALPRPTRFHCCIKSGHRPQEQIRVSIRHRLFQGLRLAAPQRALDLCASTTSALRAMTTTKAVSREQYQNLVLLGRQRQELRQTVNFLR